MISDDHLGLKAAADLVLGALLHTVFAQMYSDEVSEAQDDTQFYEVSPGLHLMSRWTICRES